MKNIKKIIVIIMMLAVVVGIMPTMERNVEAADCEHDWCPVVKETEQGINEVDHRAPLPDDIFTYGTNSLYMCYNGKLFLSHAELQEYQNAMFWNQDPALLPKDPSVDELFGGWSSCSFPSANPFTGNDYVLVKLSKGTVLTTSNTYHKWHHDSENEKGGAVMIITKYRCSKCGAIKEKG